MDSKSFGHTHKGEQLFSPTIIAMAQLTELLMRYEIMISRAVGITLAMKQDIRLEADFIRKWDEMKELSVESCLCALQTTYV